MKTVIMGAAMLLSASVASAQTLADFDEVTCSLSGELVDACESDSDLDCSDQSFTIKNPKAPPYISPSGSYYDSFRVRLPRGAIFSRKGNVTTAWWPFGGGYCIGTIISYDD